MANRKSGAVSARSRRGSARNVPEHLVERVGADEYRYIVNEDGTARIVSCKPGSREVSIPETLGQRAVSELADTSFSQKLNVECIRCPRSLRRIGHRAFQGCMHLESIYLNEGLEQIGEEAFFLCPALSQVRLPRTVRGVGVNMMGSQDARWRYQDGMRFVSESPNVIVGDDGLVYQRNDTGLTLVDGSRFAQATLVCDEHTTAIGPKALASNAVVERVVCPEGLASIGEAAFRGCSALKRIDLPSTLREIGEGAFSCSGIESLSLPRACADLAPNALITGPVSEGNEIRAFSSALRSVSVEEGNASYVARGGIVYRIAEDGAGLEAVLCPAGTDEAVVDAAAMRVRQGAFAGAAQLSLLRVREGLEFDGSQGLLPHGVCRRVVIELGRGRDGFDVVDVEIPSGQLGRTVVREAFAQSPVSAPALLSAYDKALLRMDDRLEQARLMIARLARPVCLDAKTRKAFWDVVKSGLANICVHFGARNYWKGFDMLVECKMMDRGAICRAIDILSGIGDGPAVGYLLELQRRHFAESMWDYAI